MLNLEEYREALDKVKKNSFQLFEELNKTLNIITYKYFDIKDEIYSSTLDIGDLRLGLNPNTEQLYKIDNEYKSTIKEILNEYLNYLNKQDLFEFFFTSRSPDIYYLIVNKYENIIRNYFIEYSDVELMKMLVTSKHNLLMYPEPVLASPDDNYQSDMFFLFGLPIDEVATDFYLRFGDVLNFKMKGNLNALFRNINFNYDNQEAIFSKNSKYEKYLAINFVARNCNTLFHSFKNQDLMAKVFSYIKLCQRNKCLFSYNYKIFYLNCHVGNIEEITIDNNTNILSEDYMKVIKFLRNIKPKERRKYECYHNAYLLFYNYLDKKIDNLNEVSDIVEMLFQRVINRGFLVDALTIDNIKSLYLFYKYNALIEGSYLKKYSIEYIKDFNIKKILPYLKVSDKLSLDVIKQYFVINNIEDQDNYYFYELLYPYDILDKINDIYLLDKKLNNENVLKIIISKNIAIDYIIKLIENKNDNYLKKFKNLIIQGKEDDDLNNIIYYFDFYYKLFNQLFSYSKVKKRINSLDYVLIPSNRKIKENLLQLNNVAKGDPQLEKLYGIKLYQEYKNRIYSSIPDISGSYQELNYQMVDMHDLNIISNGIGDYILPNNIYASSCLTPNGKASSCLFHGATSPHGRFFKIESNNDIIAYSWIWRAGEVLCFDNIELTKSSENISYIDNKIYNILNDVALNMIKLTNEDIKLVILGRNKIDVPNKYFDQLEKSKTIYKPNQDKLYLKDSFECQLIIKGIKFDNLNTKDVEPKFLYKRKEVKKFSEYQFSELLKKVNAIYYDYCVEHNLKYQEIYFVPNEGFIAEDWYYYKNKDDNFAYCGNDDRLFSEAYRYINKDYRNIYIKKENKLDYSNVLDISNYQVKNDTLKEYLKSLKDITLDLKDNDYLHNSHNFNLLTKILIDGYITSSNYGKRNKTGANNGKYYISVAKNNTEAWNNYYGKYAFIFNDINPQPIVNNIFENINILTNTTYPIRPSGIDGEYQMYEKINVENAKALIASNDINELVILTNLLEILDLDISIYKDSKQHIDKNEVKKLFKYKVH